MLRLDYLDIFGSNVIAFRSADFGVENGVGARRNLGGGNGGGNPVKAVGMVAGLGRPC